MNGGNILKCQCDRECVASDSMQKWFNPITEWNFIKEKHKKFECKCTNDVKQYVREGRVFWLCSCCHDTDDIPYNRPSYQDLIRKDMSKQLSMEMIK